MRKNLHTGLLILLSFHLYSHKTVFKPAEWSQPGIPHYGLLSDAIGTTSDYVSQTLNG